MEVVNTFSPVAAEYCWVVINLHSLAQDKGPINWKELLKDEDRGQWQSNSHWDLTQQMLQHRDDHIFFFFLVIYNLSWQVQIQGGGEDECSPLYWAHLGF